MRVVWQDGGPCVLKMSQQEWENIGDKAGWREPEPTVPPIADRMDVAVEKYGDRTWAVYVNGDLLCVTAYRKGAMAVKALIEGLWGRVQGNNIQGAVSLTDKRAS